MNIKKFKNQVALHLEEEGFPILNEGHNWVTIQRENGSSWHVLFSETAIRVQRTDRKVSHPIRIKSAYLVAISIERETRPGDGKALTKIGHFCGKSGEHWEWDSENGWKKLR